MTTQAGNVFIVQTSGSNYDDRSRGSRISLINKQSALYKYRQQKRKNRERRDLPEPNRSPPVRTFDAQRTSWLLESRLPQSPGSSNGSPSSGASSRSEGAEDEESISISLTSSHPPSVACVPEVSATSGHQHQDCYGGLRTDPFCCIPIEDSSVVLSVSDTYTNVIIPHVSQLAKIFNVHDVYLDIFWAMIFHEDTIDAVVAMSYCADAKWQRSAGWVPRKDVFIHQGRSLANLRRRLSDSDAANTGITICALMYNCNIARFLGNMEAAKQHMAMIRHLLRTSVSLDSLGFQGKLRSLLLQWEYWLTLSGDEEPLVSREDCPESTYPDLPLRGPMAGVVSALPRGFGPLAESGRLSCQVLQVLARMQEMLVAMTSGRIQMFLSTPNQDPYPDFCSAVPCLYASKGGEAGLERLLCCALFLLTSRLLSPRKQVPWSLPVTGGRTILTQQTFNCQVESDIEKRCLIWIWLIAIDSWAVESGDIPETARWLMQRLRERYPETSAWSYVSNVVSDFFWTQDLETSCEGYWRSCQ